MISAADKHIKGPESRVLYLSHGYQGRLAGEPENVYERAEIVISNHSKVQLQLGEGYLCDGSYIEGQASPIKNGQQVPPLQVWSQSERYIVLQLVQCLPNGSFNFRNALLFAFDTPTGEIEDFRSATSIIGVDSFLRWSDKEPDTAVLQRNHGSEAAHVAR